MTFRAPVRNTYAAIPYEYNDGKHDTAPFLFFFFLMTAGVLTPSTIDRVPTGVGVWWGEVWICYFFFVPPPPFGKTNKPRVEVRNSATNSAFVLPHVCVPPLPRRAEIPPKNRRTKRPNFIRRFFFLIF